MVKWVENNRIHFTVWMIFIIYDLGLVSLMNRMVPSPIIDPLHFAINICFFYLHAHVVLPFILKNSNRRLYLAAPIIVAQLIVYVLIHYWTDKILIALEVINLNREYTLNFNVISRNLYRGVYFFGFSTGYYFLRNYLIQRKKTEKLEKERLESIIEQQKITQELMLAENAFLKAQINPHFLFNTLDFIYHKVNRHSEIAGDAIVKLAEMMRFAIDTDEKDGSAMLAKELEQVENLIYLYQIRKSQPLNVYFAYSPAVKQLRLIPLILLTLVENIFKHGDLSNADDIAVLNLDILNEQLVIETTNLIAIKQATHSNNSGLANIEKRLNYTYGDAVTFNYNIGHRHFSLKITIPLTLVNGSSSPAKLLSHNGK